ncbi:MAG: tetratricopeptide repeat protein [Blastocatellia bacterium]|nr:tetratricopeptide repeat protein [Blastocatellia bacterium]
MDERTEQENLLRWYLLGATSLEEDEQIELRLRNREITDELLLAEEGLIDDYAMGMLPPYERELFERNFISIDGRRLKLLISEAAVRHAAKRKNAETEAYTWRTALNRFVFKHWKIAYYTVLLFIIGFGVFPWSRGHTELVEGLRALKNAYREQRPTEARITGFPYAGSNLPRGAKATIQIPPADFRGRDEAESHLHKAAREDENAETLHALGKLYLARRDFDKAIDQFEKALAYNRNDASIHSDYAAALIEKIKNTGSQKIERPEIVDQAFSHLNRALELDGNLLEALFNRALLYHLQNLREPAQEAWKKYLEKDSVSEWADEARSHLR